MASGRHHVYNILTRFLSFADKLLSVLNVIPPILNVLPSGEEILPVSFITACSLAI